jgi:hypothetical protein
MAVETVKVWAKVVVALTTASESVWEGRKR